MTIYEQLKVIHKVNNMLNGTPPPINKAKEYAMHILDLKSDNPEFTFYINRHNIHYLASRLTDKEVTKMANQIILDKKLGQIISSIRRDIGLLKPLSVMYFKRHKINFKSTKNIINFIFIVMCKRIEKSSENSELEILRNLVDAMSTAVYECNEHCVSRKVIQQMLYQKKFPTLEEILCNNPHFGEKRDG